MSWSTWGLAEIRDEAPLRTMLATRGRVLVLTVDAHRAETIEELSDRWCVTSMEFTSGSPRPRAGDIAIWCARGRDDETERELWGGPTRVLSVVIKESESRLEICCLEDALVNELTVHDSPWLDEVLATDQVVPAHDEWRLLSLWNLHPSCPRCGGTTKLFVYGMTTADPPSRKDLIMAGCVVGDADPDYRCDACGHEFQLPRPGPGVADGGQRPESAAAKAGPAGRGASRAAGQPKSGRRRLPPKEITELDLVRQAEDDEAATKQWDRPMRARSIRIMPGGLPGHGRRR